MKMLLRATTFINFFIPTYSYDRYNTRETGQEDSDLEDLGYKQMTYKIQQKMLRIKKF